MQCSNSGLSSEKSLKMIFAQYSIVLTFCIAFISANKPYFQHSYYSPNELTDGSVEEIDWAAKFNDPDFKDAIHYRLGNPVRKVMAKPETKRNDQTKPETNINNKTQETIKTDKQAKQVMQGKEKQRIVDSMAGSSELSHVVDNMNMNNRHSYPFHHIHNNAKEEILVHRPSPIIVKRPPTKVLINHPPLVVKPAPVIFHRPPAIIMRPIYVNSKPQPVKVQPVYVKVVKKNEKDAHHTQTAKDSMYDDLENDCIHKKPGVYSNY